MQSGVPIPVFDARAWPLVVSTLPTIVDDDTVQRLVDGHREVFARRERFVHIGDLRQLRTLPNARIRQRLADWTKSIEGESARYNVGSALVVPNAVVRGGLTALSWLYKPVSPQYYGAAVEECHAWCMARLEEAGVPISLAAREYGVKLRIRRL